MHILTYFSDRTISVSEILISFQKRHLRVLDFMRQYQIYIFIVFSFTLFANANLKYLFALFLSKVHAFFRWYKVSVFLL